MKRAINPLCEWCERDGRLEPMVDVDHVVPVKQEWERRLDVSNLQSLCRSCHAKKTAEDREKYG
ncbi:HNH endonuclease signature motif containing protein [Alkalihalophilus marmarensis]